jgi:hypothetical protein
MFDLSETETNYATRSIHGQIHFFNTVEGALYNFLQEDGYRFDIINEHISFSVHRDNDLGPTLTEFGTTYEARIKFNAKSNYIVDLLPDNVINLFPTIKEIQL